MSGLVLIVGALMVAAGGYEMVAGNGDILSERGWSAFIAGSVFISGGIVTIALGLAVRALERLGGALGSKPAIAIATRVEPAAAGAFVAPSVDLHEAQQAPSLEQAPTAPVLAAPPISQAAFVAHEDVAHEVPAHEVPAHADPAHEPIVAHDLAGGAEPPHADWLDQSFAELERDLGARHEPATLAAAAHQEGGSAHPEPAHAATLQAHDTADPHDPAETWLGNEALTAAATHELIAHEPAPLEPALHEAAFHEPAPHEAALHEEASPKVHADDPAVGHDDPTAVHATVSAREQETPPTAAVIGRYESEGTSYVMYADGSIDAQSEAGVYRFASMSELKAFIES